MIVLTTTTEIDSPATAEVVEESTVRPEPKKRGRKPNQPAATQPALTQPAPTQPAPTQPTPTQPQVDKGGKRSNRNKK